MWLNYGLSLQEPLSSPYSVGDIVSLSDPQGVPSGISIEITSIDVQRLFWIDTDDAIREGVQTVDEFIELWGTIYGPRNEFAWNNNPWVFVYGFYVYTGEQS